MSKRGAVQRAPVHLDMSLPHLSFSSLTAAASAEIRRISRSFTEFGPNQGLAGWVNAGTSTSPSRAMYPAASGPLTNTFLCDNPVRRDTRRFPLRLDKEIPVDSH